MASCGRVCVLHLSLACCGTEVGFVAFAYWDWDRYGGAGDSGTRSRGNSKSHLSSERENEMADICLKIQFCRSTTNREVPSSRVWRVMAPTSLDECNTEIVTLKVGATEEWKLWPDDEILLGDPGQLDEKMPTARKFIQSATDSDKDASDEELGDDRAEEGKLGLERHSGRGRYRRLTDC